MALAGTDPLPPSVRDPLDDGVFVLAFDGLDEVSAKQRTMAILALLAAVERWPQHRWVVASRPVPELQELGEAGFAAFWAWPSEGLG